MISEELPDEILLEIGKHLDPASVAMLSFSCRRIFNCFSKLLDEYRDAAKGRVKNDRDPMEILDLVRLATRGDSHAWFLRRLELWGARRCFHVWKSYPELDAHYVHDNPDNPESLCWDIGESLRDYSHLEGSIFSDEELDIYARILTEDFHLTPCFTASALNQIRGGNQEVLCVFILAKSPAISTLMLAEHEDYGGEYPFWFLNMVISNLIHDSVPSPVWPIGFQSLKTIAINMSTLSWPNSGLQSLRCPDGVSFNVGMWHIEALFYLPNLKTLLLHSLVGYDTTGWVCECGNDCEWSVPARTSSIENLYIAWDEVTSDEYVKMLTSIKSLRSLDIEGQLLTDPEDKREVTSTLIHTHGPTLERANLAPKTRQTFGFDSTISYIQLKKCPELKYLGLTVTALRKLVGGEFTTSLHLKLPLKLKVLVIRGTIIGNEEYFALLAGLRLLAEKRGSTTAGANEGRLEDICTWVKFQLEKGQPAVKTKALMNEEEARDQKNFQATVDHCEQFGVKIHIQSDHCDSCCNFKERHIDPTIAALEAVPGAQV